MAGPGRPKRKVTEESIDLERAKLEKKAAHVEIAEETKKAHSIYISQIDKLDEAAKKIEEQFPELQRTDRGSPLLDHNPTVKDWVLPSLWSLDCIIITLLAGAAVSNASIGNDYFFYPFARGLLGSAIYWLPMYMLVRLSPYLYDVVAWLLFIPTMMKRRPKK